MTKLSMAPKPIMGTALATNRVRKAAVLGRAAAMAVVATSFVKTEGNEWVKFIVDVVEWCAFLLVELLLLVLLLLLLLLLLSLLL